MGPGDAAKLLGVRPITVWRWETGRSMPSAADLRRITKVTGGAVTPNDFFGVQPPAPVLDALREAQATFRHYAEIHAAKPGGLGIKKAEDNSNLAGRMGAALALLEGAAS